MSRNDFEDRVIQCAGCADKFIFLAGEQAFYEKKGFSDPKRCKKCRADRKKVKIEEITKKL